MSNREQALEYQNKKLIKQLDDMRQRLIPLNGVDEYIANQNKVIEKYNNWFQYNAKWINAYNRMMRWNTEQAMVARYRVSEEELEEVILLMRERVERLHEDLSTVDQIKEEGNIGEEVEED